jgi:hypothetical protein
LLAARESTAHREEIRLRSVICKDRSVEPAGGSVKRAVLTISPLLSALAVTAGCGSISTTSGSDSDEVYGQGVKAFGASRYVLAPNGRKIDNS